MNLRLAVFCLLMVITTIAYGQADSVKRKASYYNAFLTGALIGCGECANGKDFTFSFLTLQGVRLQSGVKLALGAGMDVYNEWRLFPVVGAITIDRELRENAFYFHLNAGYSWGRYLEDLESEISLNQRGGFTVNPMIGYRIGKGKSRIYVQAGYKLQYAKVSYTSPWWWGPPPTITREYDLSRVVVQMGFGFN